MPAKNKQPENPEEWGNSGQEVETFGLGKGFAVFEQVGQHLRGVVRTFFPTKHGPAMTVELTDEPSTPFYMTNEGGNREEIKPTVGDLVNVSLSPVELNRKIDNAMLDRQVGIQYISDVKTRGGSMKNYRVLVFEG